MNDATRPSEVEYPAFLVLFGLNIFLFLLFIFIEVRYFKMKINIPLIVILLTLFVVNLINITTIPLDNTINYVYLDNPNSVLISISDTDKLMYILCFFLMTPSSA